MSIPELLPDQVVVNDQVVYVTVAQKAGFFQEGINSYTDAGIVMVGNKAYVVVYLSQNNANYLGSPAFGAELSGMAWNAFAKVHGFK